MIRQALSRTDQHDLAAEVSEGLQNFAHWVDGATAYAAKKLQLHVTDLTLIGMLYASPQGVSPKQMIDQLGFTSGAATALIDRLEKVGYVRRVQNPDDRRSVLIQLVEENSKNAVAFYRSRQRVYSDLMKQFSDDELRTVLRFVGHLTAIDPAVLVQAEQT